MPRHQKTRKCEVFVLDFTAARSWDKSSWDKLPNWGWFAVDEAGPGWMARRIFMVKGLDDLRETLESCAAAGMLPDPNRVHVLTAVCERDFPDRAREEILRSVLSGIAPCWL